MDAFLSSAEAASYLGVGPTSIKRWTDEGLLPCERTAGGHRRFRRSDLERLRTPPHGQWLDDLLGPANTPKLEAHLFTRRAELGDWWRVAIELGAAIDEIGRRWAAGTITVVEEHIASDRLSRALHRVCDWLPSSPDAPRALLATAEGDDHTLGLSLVELCLRELGWTVLWSGPRTPNKALAQAVASLARDAAQLKLLAVSASAASVDAHSLATQAERLAKTCGTCDVALLLGGSGAWPEALPHGEVLRDLAALPARFSAQARR